MKPSFNPETHIEKIAMIKWILEDRYVGRSNPITGKNLREILRAYGIKIDSRLMRMVVRHLRRTGVPICSQGGIGYWFAKNLNEVIDMAAKELHAKAMDLLETESALVEGAKIRFGNQSELL